MNTSLQEKFETGKEKCKVKTHQETPCTMFTVKIKECEADIFKKNTQKKLVPQSKNIKSVSGRNFCYVKILHSNFEIFVFCLFRSFYYFF